MADTSRQIREMLAWMRRQGVDQFGQSYATLNALMDDSTGAIREGLLSTLVNTDIYLARDVMAAAVMHGQITAAQVSTFDTGLRMFSAMGVGERQDVDALLRHYGMTTLVQSSVQTAQGVTRGQATQMAVSFGGAQLGGVLGGALRAGDNRSRSVITGQFFTGGAS